MWHKDKTGEDRGEVSPFLPQMPKIIQKSNLKMQNKNLKFKILHFTLSF
jgi:hypothetical protein